MPSPAIRKAKAPRVCKAVGSLGAASLFSRVRRSWSEPVDESAAEISGDEHGGRDRAALASCCGSPPESQCPADWGVCAEQFWAAQMRAHQGSTSSARVTTTAKPQAQ